MAWTDIKRLPELGRGRGATAIAVAAAFLQTPAARAQEDALAQRRSCDTSAGAPATPGVEAGVRSDAGIAEIERALRQADCATPLQRAAPGTRVTTVQERDRPEYRPHGVHLEGFTFFPSAGAALRAESNVFRTADSDADIALISDMNLRLQSNWSRHALQIEAAAENRTHARYSSEDTTDYDVTGLARADLYRRGTLTAHLSHGRATVDRGAAGEIQRTLRPVRYDRTVAELRAAYPGMRVGGEVSLRSSARDYANSQDLTGAPIDEQHRDFHRSTLTARIDYNGKPGSAVSLLFRQDWIDLRQDLPFDRDRRITTVSVAYRSEINPLIRLNAAIGVLVYDYDDPALPSTTRPAFDVQADWTVTELTTVRLAARRDVAESGDRAAAVETRTTFEIGVDHELLRNLVLSAELEYQIADFVERDGSDTRWRQTIGARWLINRNLTTTLQLRGEQRRYASRTAFNFDNYQLGAGLRYAF